jgi:zinc transport system ATP-binding protein
MAEPEGMAVGTALVRTVSATLILGGRTILDGVNVKVERGEIVTIVGPNGAGKSTLLRVMLGLMPQSGGTVERAGDLVVGYVPQRFHMPTTLPLSVDRLLTLTARAKRAARTAVLEETGIAHLQDAPVADLSGGELQRALIAKALLRSPNLLVLDEPVQGVDFIGEARLYRLISDIRRNRGCGILMVSHDLHVVMGESDRVVCLNGHVCCEGQPASVQADPEFARMFGPDAARVVGIYAHDHDHTHEGGEVCPVHGHEHRHGA